MELECRDDRCASGSACSTSTGLLDPYGACAIKNSPVVSPNVFRTESSAIKEDTHSASSHLDVPVVIFDASTQQLIDSMKYTDLILSVEPVSITTRMEIPCHKFMLAKKVHIQ